MSTNLPQVGSSRRSPIAIVRLVAALALGLLAHAAHAVTHDVNNLTIDDSSGDVVDTITNASATGGSFIRYKSNAVNDFIKFNVNVAATATYQVTVRYQKWSAHGKVQLQVSGTNQGGVVDLYNSTTQWVNVDLGTVALTAGVRAFRFNVTGKNANATNYYLGLDAITLTAVGGDTTPPTVSMTAPADGATVSGNVTVSATASDNVGVVGVQFKLNGGNLGAEDTNSPYSITWNTVGATNAQHVLTATARDAAGNSTTSTGRLVTVNNPRNLQYEFDLETGQLQANTSMHDGIGAKTQLVNGPTKSISNVTKANPGVVTSNSHGYANDTGVTITNVNGMTQLNGRLFRVKNKTTNTFQLWEDHPPGSPNPDPEHDLGLFQVNTSSYGTYSSGGTLMKWVEQIINSGGAGPGSNFDVRVEATESVGGLTVLPRKGSYFLRSAIYFNKDYSVFSGNGGINKSRWNGTLPAATDYDYDTETWHGISFFIPPNYEDETARKGKQGENQLLDLSEDAGPSGGGFFIISVMVPGGLSNVGGIQGDTAHWIGMESHSATSTTSPTFRFYDLGEVDPDKGKWTDFIIRSRVNPFSVATNPAAQGIAQARNQTYPGNKGILQVWKATGSVNGNGDRTMTLMIDRENEPVGMVPRQGFLIGASVRQYKYGWHHHATAVTGPVWIGYDELRIGQTVRDGTGYSDVHPSRLPMP